MKGFIRGVVNVLNTDVREFGSAIVAGAKSAKMAITGAVATGFAVMQTEPAFADAADLLTAATTELTAVKDTGWSMGALIVGAVAVLVCIGIVLKLLNKA